MQPFATVSCPLFVRLLLGLNVAEFMMRNVFWLVLSEVAKASLPPAFLNVPPESVTVALLVLMYWAAPVIFRFESSTHWPPVSTPFLICVTDPALTTAPGRIFSAPAMLKACGAVNPALVEVLGEKSYGSLNELPVNPDVVNVFRVPAMIPGIVDEMLMLGLKNLWVQQGIVNREAAERAEAGGVRVVMDRCSMVEHRRLF